MTELARKLPDTNTILRYLLDDVPHLSAKASAFFEKVRVGKEKVLILESVLAECVYVLIKFYKVPKAEVVEKLKGLLLYKGIANEDKKDLVEALNIFSGQSEQGVDIVDCILCAKTRNHNLHLFSFDEKLLKLCKVPTKK